VKSKQLRANIAPLQRLTVSEARPRNTSLFGSQSPRTESAIKCAVSHSFISNSVAHYCALAIQQMLFHWCIFVLSPRKLLTATTEAGGLRKLRCHEAALLVMSSMAMSHHRFTTASSGRVAIGQWACRSLGHIRRIQFECFSIAGDS